MFDNYDNFDNFNQKPQEPVMSSEEKKSHKKFFSKICLAFLAFITITHVLSFIISDYLYNIDPSILGNNNLVIILSSVLQYGIGFPLLLLMLKKIPKQAPIQNQLSTKSFLKYAAVSVFFMYVGNTISSYLMLYVEKLLGKAPINSVDTVLDSTNVILSILFIGIIGPIVEEVMFRKLFTDRLTPYGDKIAIFLPALIFGLFHVNLYQFFYAFFLGAIFSYIYVKTGKLIYTCILHMFINLFFGVLPSFIFSKINLEELIELSASGGIPEAYVEANIMPLTLMIIYSFVMYGLIFAGIFILSRSVRNITFNKGKVKLPKGEGADIIFFNAGSILLITICLILTALNTFLV